VTWQRDSRGSTMWVTPSRAPSTSRPQAQDASDRSRKANVGVPTCPAAGAQSHKAYELSLLSTGSSPIATSTWQPSCKADTVSALQVHQQQATDPTQVVVPRPGIRINRGSIPSASAGNPGSHRPRTVHGAADACSRPADAADRGRHPAAERVADRRDVLCTIELSHSPPQAPRTPRAGPTPSFHRTSVQVAVIEDWRRRYPKISWRSATFR